MDKELRSLIIECHAKIGEVFVAVVLNEDEDKITDLLDRLQSDVIAFRIMQVMDIKNKFVFENLISEIEAVLEFFTE